MQKKEKKYLNFKFKVWWIENRMTSFQQHQGFALQLALELVWLSSFLSIIPKTGKPWDLFSSILLVNYHFFSFSLVDYHFCSFLLVRGWCIKFATGLNIRIAHSSKSIWVIQLSYCQNDPLMGESLNHFGNRTAGSLIYFLNYGIFWYLAQLQIWCTTLYVQWLRIVTSAYQDYNFDYVR